MFLGADGFRFDQSVKKRLRDTLGGYDDQAIIADLEAAAEIFVVVKASEQPHQGTFLGLKRLAAAAEALERELRRIEADEAGRDVLTEGLARLGYSSAFRVRLKEGLTTLQDAVRTPRRPLKRGRRRERARDALVQDVAEILRRHQPTETRRKILVGLAKQGMPAPAGGAERLAQVVSLVLRGVKEMIPRDLGGLLRDCGVTGKK